MKRLFYILIFLLILHQNLPLFACTGVVVSNDELTLVGNNEDYINPLTKVWFIPARDGKNGCVFFGFDNYIPQGGMNDKGLFFDIFATAPLKVTGSLNKERYTGSLNLFDKVMRECATVEEVIDVYKKYNLEFFERSMLFFADKSGDSVIIEGDEFIRKKGSYQIVTNFYQSKATPGAYPCWRYNKAKKILDESNEVSVDLCRRILEATHQNQPGSTTLYSNVYDLKKGIVHLYYFHDFTKKVTIDLKKELARGKHFHDLPTLFPKNPEAEAYNNYTLAGLKRIDEKRWEKADPKDFKAFTGLYQLEQDSSIQFEIYLVNNKLYSKHSRSHKGAELIPVSKESFYVNLFPGNIKITFHKNENDIVTGALIEDGPNLNKIYRIPD